ncbi:MAG TPA: hypothetical protein VID03_08105 [Acidimicrobiia bacterium]
MAAIGHEGMAVVLGAALGLPLGLLLLETWWIGPLIGVIVGVLIGVFLTLRDPRPTTA